MNVCIVRLSIPHRRGLDFLTCGFAELESQDGEIRRLTDELRNTEYGKNQNKLILWLSYSVICMQLYKMKQEAW